LLNWVEHTGFAVVYFLAEVPLVLRIMAVCRGGAIIECTGVGQVIAESIQKIGANGIICLAGIGHGGAATSATIADVASSVVLQNNVIVGSVNANNGTGTGPASILPVLTARGCLNSLPGANNRRSS
jgi:threonine dehydrogenase-like Zn-dependent dehydrogenase